MKIELLSTWVSTCACHRISVSMQDGCPSKVVFVLKKGETWTNNGGSGYSAFLKPPGVDELHSKIMAAEGTYEHWSLFSRFNMALSILEAADAAGQIVRAGWTAAMLAISARPDYPAAVLSPSPSISGVKCICCPTIQTSLC